MRPGRPPTMRPDAPRSTPQFVHGPRASQAGSVWLTRGLWLAQDHSPNQSPRYFRRVAASLHPRIKHLLSLPLSWFSSHNLWETKIAALPLGRHSRQFSCEIPSLQVLSQTTTSTSTDHQNLPKSSPNTKSLTPPPPSHNGQRLDEDYGAALQEHPGRH